jgi:hypothetical protein
VRSAQVSQVDGVEGTRDDGHIGRIF